MHIHTHMEQCIHTNNIHEVHTHTKMKKKHNKTSVSDSSEYLKIASRLGKKKRKETLERSTEFGPQRYIVQMYGSHKQ